MWSAIPVYLVDPPFFGSTRRPLPPSALKKAVTYQIGRHLQEDVRHEEGKEGDVVIRSMHVEVFFEALNAGIADIDPGRDRSTFGEFSPNDKQEERLPINEGAEEEQESNGDQIEIDLPQELLLEHGVNLQISSFQTDDGIAFDFLDGNIFNLGLITDLVRHCCRQGWFEGSKVRKDCRMPLWLPKNMSAGYCDTREVWEVGQAIGVVACYGRTTSYISRALSISSRRS